MMGIYFEQNKREEIKGRAWQKTATVSP